MGIVWWVYGMHTVRIGEKNYQGSILSTVIKIADWYTNVGNNALNPTL